MLDAIYVAVAAATAAILAAAGTIVLFLMFSQGVGPLWGGTIALLFLAGSALSWVRFVAVEGFGRDMISWWPTIIPDGPVALKLAAVFALWAFVGALILFGDTFDQWMRAIAAL